MSTAYRLLAWVLVAAAMVAVAVVAFAYLGEWALVALCALLVLLPPRRDPAIRWKERQMRRARRERW